jgi:putative transposase
MVDGVAELGVLTASAEEWSVAVRRAEVIGRLAREPQVCIAEADEAAAELGISRRQVYGLLKRWRAGSGAGRRVRYPSLRSSVKGGGKAPLLHHKLMAYESALAYSERICCRWRM